MMITMSIYLAHLGIWVPCYAPHIQGGEYAVSGLKLARELGKAGTLRVTIPPTNRVRSYNGDNDGTILYESERDRWEAGETELQLWITGIPLRPGLTLEIGGYQYVVLDTGDVAGSLQPITISEGLKEDVENWTAVTVIETITPLQTSVIIRDGSEILFYGRVLSIERDAYNSMELVCEDPLAFLNDSIIAPNDTSIYSYNSSTKTGSFSGPPGTYVERVLAAHNSQVNPDRQIRMGHVSASPADDTTGTTPIPGYVLTSTSPRYYTAEADTTVSGFLPISWFASRAGSWGNGATRRIRMEAQGLCYELIQNAVNELYGVRKRYDLPASAYIDGAATTATISVSVTEYKSAWETLQADGITDAGYTLSARAEEENGEIVVYLDLLSREGCQGEQEILFGHNLLDFDEYIEATDVYTRVIPIGKNGITIASANGGAIYLENEALSAVYGKITKVVQHSDISSSSQLLSAGKADLNGMITAALNLTIKAIDMTITGAASEAFYIGGYNRVRSILHGYDTYLQCVRIVKDLLDPSKDEYTFGATRDSMSATVAALAAGK